MAVKTIMIEIDVEEGEESAVKELLAYLSYTKKIKKFIWKEREALPPKMAHTHAHKPAEATAEVKAKPAEAKNTTAHMVGALSEQLTAWKSQDKLVRLKVVKDRGKMLDIACKILGQDEAEGMVTVYDVDRKVVEKVRVTEIEDIKLAL